MITNASYIQNQQITHTAPSLYIDIQRFTSFRTININKYLSHFYKNNTQNIIPQTHQYSFSFNPVLIHWANGTNIENSDICAINPVSNMYNNSTLFDKHETSWQASNDKN
jgi:hypothetical protein